jgi:hypothetical protein
VLCGLRRESRYDKREAVVPHKAPKASRAHANISTGRVTGKTKDRTIGQRGMSLSFSMPQPSGIDARSIRDGTKINSDRQYLSY